MIKIGMMIGGRYELLEKIGIGGMSEVYKVKDFKLNRFGAAKILKQEFSINGDFISKFRMEAQMAAGIMHPNIIDVYDAGEEDGIFYIVMELVEGITLKNYIERKGRLSLRETVSIAVQAAMGVGAAHNNQIIHRDIKERHGEGNGFRHCEDSLWQYNHIQCDGVGVLYFAGTGKWGAAMKRVISIRWVLRFLRCSQEGCLLAGKLRWILLSSISGRNCLL